MNNPYSQKQILTEPLGNNAFAWQEREVLYGQSPTLTIPSLIDGTLDDVILWEDVVFEELEDGQIRSCTGLQNFVRIIRIDETCKPGVRGESTVWTKMKAIWENEQSEEEWVWLPHETFGTFGHKSTEIWKKIWPQEIIIFDNHNHALYFWIDAVRRWIMGPWFDVIHIDEHSDLWDNPNELDLKKAIENEQYAWEFTNLSCNVGNYIQPALRSWLVKQVIRIENEYQIDEYMHYSPRENTILNLDIDIFAPELDHIPDHKKIKIIKNLLKKVKYVTIATSPYFIEQWKAVENIVSILR